MGGSNSGRHGGKRTTNRMAKLDVRLVHRAGSLASGMYSSLKGAGYAAGVMHACDDRVTLSYQRKNQAGEWQDYRYPVAVEWTACNYGGKRPWWICPECGRRVAVLYSGQRYACRHCQRLAYQSTRNSPESQAFARANKVRKRLGWCAGVANPPGGKPKGMHQNTFERWLLIYYALSDQAFGAASASMDKMMGRLKDITQSIGEYKK